VADGLPGIHKAEILGLCDEVDILSRQLSDLCRRGHGNTPQAQDIARYMSGVVNLLVMTSLCSQCVLLTYDLPEVTELLHYLPNIS
jgi:hypothetical protein